MIPTFGTLDANFSYRLPAALQATQLNVGVSNLLSCSAENVTFRTRAVRPPALSQPNNLIIAEDRGCGFNRTHREMVNMPYIGTMVFVGARWNVR